MGRVSTAEQQYFSPKVDYAVILSKLKEDFNKRFSRNTPSQSIGLDNYIIKASLGSGSFGKVVLVKEKDNDSYFASKQLSKDQIIKTKQVGHVMSEKKVLNSIRFPFTIHLVTSFKDNDSLYLIIPLVLGGELFTYHRKWVSKVLRYTFPLNPFPHPDKGNSAKSRPGSIAHRYSLPSSICTTAVFYIVIWSQRTLW